VILLALVALLTLSKPLVVPVEASTGNIFVDTTVAPSNVIEVKIGGTVNLYFGSVEWSGGVFDLYLSTDGYASLTDPGQPGGDTSYGPTFSVAILQTDALDTTTYPGYTVGYNWINGTIPKLDVPGGNYWAKAFDGQTAAVAVTDNYITILATFEVTPSSGPGQAAIELKGYALPTNDYANLSYDDGSGWKTIVDLYPADENGRFVYAMTAPDLKEALAAGNQTEAYTTITFQMTVNSTGQVETDTFDEYKRGLKQVYSPDSLKVTAPSGSLYGNETDFVYFGLYVKLRSDLLIAGKWFHPGTVTILWDGTTAIGNTTADENGFFNTTVTVPITSEGLHNVLIEDATIKFLFKVHCLAVFDETAPNAEAGPDQTVDEDTVVTFDGSGSTDNIGILSYIWTFIDVTPQNLTVISATYNFTTPGVYIVLLNVTDVAGNWDTDELVITVLDATAPIADAGPDQTVDEDTLVSLDGSNSTDNVEIASYVWSFMDVEPQTLTGVTATYTFETPGVYIVTLNVTDARGNWGTDTVMITVLDLTKPVAEAGLNQTAAEDTPVSFDAGNSSDNVGIVSYEWDFGDETSGTGLTINHSYANPGTYTVTLKVKDAANNSDTDSIVITVLLDTDGDGIPDVSDVDDDDDGMPDAWEIENGLNPLNAADAPQDSDGDGLTNLQEYQQGTNPNDYFSPFPLWIIGVAVAAIIGVAVVVYLVKVRKP
jgi:PKD repeat protein